MKAKLKTGLIFGVGLLIGAAVTFFCLGRMNQEQHARSYATGVIEQAFAVRLEISAHSRGTDTDDNRIELLKMAVG